MPIKDDREYRNTGCFESRRDGEKMFVTGYASTFEPYLLREFGNGEKWYEHIEPTAFDGCDMSDVVFLMDHTGTVLGRTKNGAVVLEVDAHGLHVNTDLSRTAKAREAFEAIEAQNYTQMSFSFIVDDDEYTQEGLNVTRRIKKLKKLYDVSAVAFPANPGTDIGVSYRDLFNGEIERIQAERRKAICERERLKLKLRLM